MKYFYSPLILTLLVGSLQAEETSLQELAFEPLPIQEQEIASVEQPSVSTPIEQELYRLEEEFEELKEELYTLEEELHRTEEVISSSLIAEAKAEELLEEASLSAAPQEVAFIITNDGRIDEQKQEQELPMTPLDQAIARDTPGEFQVENVFSLAVPPEKAEMLTVDLKYAFAGSPIIYTLLFAMSVLAVCIWFYSIFRLRLLTNTNSKVLKDLSAKLSSNAFDEALEICREDNTLLSKMVETGILSRRHGFPAMLDAMKTEGKRVSVNSWQRIGALNDIAIIAPLLGLLGTVLGMFYAFYDINRSIESISTLFDGLGISVGTTVAGLVVAILSLILHSTAKYRLVKALASVENNAQNYASMIDDRTSLYHKG